jgi:transposase InsO family protein
MNQVYAIAGISKQAHHQHQIRLARWIELLNNLIIEVDQIRADHPGCGLEKMHHTLHPIGIGRDRFISVFQSLGYGVRKQKNYHRTTIPTHIKFPNLIEGMRLDGPNQLWQSDITYIQVKGKFYYLVFIIDAYTKVIKGYAVSDHLRAAANQQALKMAFKNSPDNLEGLIHHSDRGSQYIDKGYQRLLSEKGIHISMGLIAQDNAYAERINGTIKNEYLQYWIIQNFKALQYYVRKAVKHYNQQRIHNQLPNRIIPMMFEEELLSLNDQDRPTVIVYAEGNHKIRGASSPSDFRPRTRPLAHDCPIVIKK